MSTSCQKALQLTVNVAVTVDAYWTMQETGLLTPRVDKVQALPLTPNGGNNGIDSTPGLFGNGMAFMESGGSSIFQTADTTGLSINTNLGWSAFMWIKVLNTAVFTSNPEIIYSDNLLQSFNIHWQLPAQLIDFTITDHTGNNWFPANLSYSLNTWFFLHLFYDPVQTQVGYSVNNGPPVLAGAGAVFGEPNPAHLRMDQNFQNGPGGPGTVSVILDEVGLKLTRNLTPAEVSFLYNNGMGRTWPLS